MTPYYADDLVTNCYSPNLEEGSLHEVREAGSGATDGHADLDHLAQGAASLHLTPYYQDDLVRR